MKKPRGNRCRKCNGSTRGDRDVTLAGNVAESETKQKDLMIRLVLSLIEDGR